MALALVCLIIGLARAKTGWFAAAAVVLVLNMTAPRIFGPASRLWFGLSGLMGAVMSKVILTIVYFLVLTPVGLLRRVLGKDTLRLAAFKKGTGSVFHTRSTPFTSADLKTPF
ncbi:MAG: SxtJ family membrane protein [Humidesulfovibrio sp.]|nr:SxtJ family membrane protein [Humidesulfovibrio sp.]